MVVIDQLRYLLGGMKMTKDEMIKEINRLKKEKNAIILAHYYQKDEVQDIADYLGDSYNLSVIAQKTDAKIIVFCGVLFMGETAKILSPDKKVLMPHKNLPCYMANLINARSLRKYKEEHPDRVVISYVNTYADVKALSDCCVTSSNALKILEHYKDQKILYCPDKNLGNYAAKEYGYDIDLWNGCCQIHDRLTLEDVKKAKEAHPNALFCVHPEAPYELTQIADYAGSTKGIIEYCTKSEATEFIIGTENGIMHELEKRNPNKKFYLLSDGLLCKSMKLISLEDVYKCLLNEEFEVTLDKDTMDKARVALDKMLEFSK